MAPGDEEGRRGGEALELRKLPGGVGGSPGGELRVPLLRKLPDGVGGQHLQEQSLRKCSLVLQRRGPLTQLFG